MKVRKMNKVLRSLILTSSFTAAILCSSIASGIAGPAAGAVEAAPQVQSQEQPAPETDTFGRSQFVLSANPIIPPRDYGKGLALPNAGDYSPDESGTIHDIAFLGIENGEMQFEVRGYSIADLNYPASGQTFSFPKDQKTVEIRDIIIEIEEVTEGSLTYRINYRK